VDELDDEGLKLDFLLVLAAFEDFKFLLGFFVEFEELSVFHLHLSVLLEEALVGVVVVHSLLVLDLVVDGVPLVAQVQDLVLQIHPQALLLLHLLVPGLQLPLSPVEVLLQNEDPLVLLTPQLDVLDEVLVVLLAAFPMTHVLPIVPQRALRVHQVIRRPHHGRGLQPRRLTRRLPHEHLVVHLVVRNHLRA